MTTSPLSDAFGHHVWATLQLLDTCDGLSAEQLDATVPGTYGTILDTLRHLVGADASYLHVTSGGAVEAIDEEGIDLEGLRAAMERHAAAWPSVVGGDVDPTQMFVRHRPDGSETHAPLGIRLAQVLHHGTDHRSQVCTALTTLGIEPPAIDVWDYGFADGRVTEVPPAG